MGRYKAYPEYKDSEVEWLGKVPQHWNIKRVGSLFEERREKVNDVDYPPLSVTMQGIVPQLDNAAKTDAGDNRKLVKAGDFVINSRSDRKGASGISPLTGSVSLISIVMSPRKYNSQFFHHLFRCQAFQEEFYRYGKGIVADLWSTNSSELKNILIPDLPEEEANRIAVFLDHEIAKIDTLIEKQQQLIQLLKEKRQAVISHAVTKGLNPNAPMKDSGVEWLGEVPGHWRLTRLKYEADLNPKNPKIKLSPSLECSFVPMEKLKTDYLLLDETRTVDEVLAGYTCFCDGDVLMAKVTPCFENKNIAVATELKNSIGFGSTEIYVLRPKLTIDKRFLFYRLQEAEFMNIATSAMTGAGGLKRVPTEVVNNFQFALPPLSEQITICEFLENQKTRFTKLDAFAQRQVELLSERRTALISAAVTGKIDVRNWQAHSHSE